MAILNPSLKASVSSLPTFGLGDQDADSQSLYLVQCPPGTASGAPLEVHYFSLEISKLQFQETLTVLNTMVTTVNICTYI